jgi:hypothetical protein
MVSTASTVDSPATSVSHTKDSIPIALRIAIASRRTPSRPSSSASGVSPVFEPSDYSALTEK